MARINDSTAYDYYYNYNRYVSGSAAPVYAPTYAPAPKMQPAAKPKKNPKSLFCLTNILTILIISALAFVTLYYSADVTRKTSQLQKAKTNLTNLEAQNQYLQIEIDRSLDLKALEEYAISELGMMRPEKYQTIYINSKQSDYVEKPHADDSIFSSTFAFISNIWSYLG